jgi:hypothetical protein
MVEQGDPIAARVELTIESAADWLLVRPEGAAPQLPASPSRTVPVLPLLVAVLPELLPAPSTPASPWVPLDAPPEPPPLDVDAVEPLELLGAWTPDEAPDDVFPDVLPWLPDPLEPPLDDAAPELDDAPPSPSSKALPLLLEDDPLHAATSATAKQDPVA